jgi:hypothetical protein
LTRAGRFPVAAVILVRLLLAIALATIGVSLFLYFVRKDRRYLRFVLQVAKFTLFVLLIVFLLFAAERLLMPVVAPLV